MSIPHNSILINTMVTDGAQVNKLIESCQMQIELNDRQLCDVELLMQGGFSPLDSFMSEDDYNSVVQSMRLKSGLLFGLPVVFDTSDPNMTPNKRVLLKSKDIPIAIFDITSRYQPNKVLEAKQCYGTTSIEHPGVWSLVTERGQFYCGGKIIGLNIPHRDFLCRSPTEIRAEIPPNVDVVAFQCRNPIHRAHYELFMKALQDPSLRPHSIVLVHPTCGPTQMDDIPGAVRYRTYEVLKHQVANPLVLWEYLPYSMHMAGPREAIQHMILRKNYGCTHFIIGRDMAGCKSSLDGKDFYGPYDAQDMAMKYAEELNIKPIISQNLVFTDEEGYVTEEIANDKKLTIKKISGTKFRQMLRSGQDIPSWFAFESVVSVLREAVDHHET